MACPLLYIKVILWEPMWPVAYRNIMYENMKKDCIDSFRMFILSYYDT